MHLTVTCEYLYYEMRLNHDSQHRIVRLLWGNYLFVIIHYYLFILTFYERQRSVSVSVYLM